MPEVVEIDLSPTWAVGTSGKPAHAAWEIFVFRHPKDGTFPHGAGSFGWWGEDKRVVGQGDQRSPCPQFVWNSLLEVAERYAYLLNHLEELPEGLRYEVLADTPFGAGPTSSEEEDTYSAQRQRHYQRNLRALTPSRPPSKQADRRSDVERLFDSPPPLNASSQPTPSVQRPPAASQSDTCDKQGTNEQGE